MVGLSVKSVSLGHWVSLPVVGLSPGQCQVPMVASRMLQPCYRTGLPRCQGQGRRKNVVPNMAVLFFFLLGAFQGPNMNFPGCNRCFSSFVTPICKICSSNLDDFP